MRYNVLNGKEVISKTIKGLKSRGFHATFAPDKVKAKDKILELISPGSSIGIGDSTTIFQIGVIPGIEAIGHRVINPFGSNIISHDNVKSLEITLRQSLGQDYFITGGNAVTEDGRIISVDRAGNRIAGMIFGARKVILAIGQNKIVRDLETAFERIKKVIAPGHARNRGFDTPCVHKGECVDCRVKDRLCNVVAILEGKIPMTDITVVLIGEDLGLGWDPEWPRERIDRIWNNYVAKCWRPDL